MIKQSKLRKSRALQRKRRHFRVRNKVQGTAERPRLVVFRSLKNIEGQLVDDDAGSTITGLSTLSPELKDFNRGHVGERLAGLPNVSLEPLAGWDEHFVLGELAARGLFADILERAVLG